MNPHVKVYQQCLSKLGHGTPLWTPEPLNVRDAEGRIIDVKEVNIGDVGRIDPRTGHWDRFFNIFFPGGVGPNRFGVPENFQPLSYERPSTVDMPRQLQGEIYASQSLQKIINRLDISASYVIILTVFVSKFLTNLQNP